MGTLAVNECKGTCAWHGTGRELDGEPLFECASCHSEWVPSQSWTPRNADGDISPDVAAVMKPVTTDDDSDWG